MDMSIHTFELTFFMNHYDYNTFHSFVYQHNTESTDIRHMTKGESISDYRIIDRYTYTCFRDIGINRCIFTKVLDGTGKPLNYNCKLVINPKHLIGDTDYPYTSIIGKDQLCNVPDAIVDFISYIFPDYHYIFNTCKLSRIDYCLNLWMQSQKEIEDYFNLLRRYNLPPLFNALEEYNEFSHRSIPRKGEITIQCKSYEISLYLKKTQMESSFYNYPDSEIAAAEGQLRIELRADRKKIFYEIKQENIENEFDLLTSPKPLDNIIGKLKIMYGSGDFYTLDKAREIINNSQFHRKTKSRLFWFLDIVNSRRSLDANKIGFGNDLEQYGKIWRQFNKLNLSPITIPSRFDHNFYPNPINYLLDKSDLYLR